MPQHYIARHADVYKIRENMWILSRDTGHEQYKMEQIVIVLQNQHRVRATQQEAQMTGQTIKQNTKNIEENLNKFKEN